MSSGDAVTGEIVGFGAAHAPLSLPMHEYLFLALRCDEPALHHSRISLDGVTEVRVGRGHADTVVVHWSDDGRRIDVDIPDRWCSRQHLLLRRHRGWIASDLHSKNGSCIGGVPFDEARLHDRDVLEIGRTIFLYRCFSYPLDVAPTDRSCHALAAPMREPDLFRTLSPVLEQQLHLLRRAAPSPLPILIQGESGTGKELAARAIHQLSGRTGPFIAINCGALTSSLLESELFGHVRGAFSGATENRPGLIRAAHHGTLFLDELAEAPQSIQVRLLRVLQEREVLVVGATTPTPVDVRVVAATHGDVHAMAKRGAFRADFLARLAGFDIRLPALRNRPEDIGHLAAGFLRVALGDRFDRLAFDNDVARALLRYPWPLNIRELARTVGAAAVMIDDRVTLAAFGERLTSAHAVPPPAISDVPSTAQSARAEGPVRGSREHVVELLRLHRGNISGVARALSTSRSHVHRLLVRYGLSQSGKPED